MGCEQLLETDDVGALLDRDFCESHGFFNISSLLFGTRYLNTRQFNQPFSSPLGIENFANANRLRINCQDLVVFAIEFFLIVFIMIA